MNARRRVGRPGSRPKRPSNLRRSASGLSSAVRSCVVAFVAVAFGISRLVGKDDNNDSVSSGTTVAAGADTTGTGTTAAAAPTPRCRCEHVRGVHRFDRHDDRRKAITGDTPCPPTDGSASARRRSRRRRRCASTRRRPTRRRSRPTSAAFTIALDPQGAEDGQQLRRALALPLLRRHPVPPNRRRTS